MRRSKRHSKNSNLQFWPSFSDLCVAFILFWILIVLITTITPAFNEGVIRRKILEDVKAAMNEGLKEGEKKSFFVDNETGTIMLNDTSVLFPSGSAELGQGGRDIIAIVGRAIVFAVGGHGENIDRIIVEGYADIDPIGETFQANYPTNWELSSARSCSVVRHILGGLKNEDNALARKFFAGGFGDSKAEHVGNEKIKDRRIEIRILTKTDMS